MENIPSFDSSPQSYLDAYQRGYPPYIRSTPEAEKWASMMQGLPPGAIPAGLSPMSLPQGSQVMGEPQQMFPTAGNDYSFMMPTGGQMMENGMPAPQMQVFQHAFGGNLPFYDTNMFGGATMPPNGMAAAYESMNQDELKKAIKKEIPIPQIKKVSKSKKSFPCC